MKFNKIYIFVSVLLILIGLGVGTFYFLKSTKVSPLDNSSYLKILSPNATNLVNAGDVFDIKWESKNLKHDVSIHLLSRDNYFIDLIAVNLKQTGNFLWNVDKNLPKGEYKIKVFSGGDWCSDGCTIVFSDSFVINSDISMPLPPSIKSVSENNVILKDKNETDYYSNLKKIYIEAERVDEYTKVAFVKKEGHDIGLNLEKEVVNNKQRLFISIPPNVSVGEYELYLVDRYGQKSNITFITLVDKIDYYTSGWNVYSNNNFKIKYPKNWVAGVATGLNNSPWVFCPKEFASSDPDLICDIKKGVGHFDTEAVVLIWPVIGGVVGVESDTRYIVKNFGLPIYIMQLANDAYKKEFDLMKKTVLFGSTDSIVVSGEYSLVTAGPLDDQFCFYVDSVASGTIPRLSSDTRMPWFCFKNHIEAKEMFGLENIVFNQTDYCALRGKAKIEISDYVVFTKEADGFDTANLDKVIDSGKYTFELCD